MPSRFRKALQRDTAPRRWALAAGIALFGCLAQTAAASPPSATPAGIPQSGAPQSNAYVIGLGDTIAVTIFDHTDLTGQFMVGPDGTFRHPLMGAIPAAGRTRAEVEGDVKQRLTHLLSYEALLSVDIATYRPIFVVGDVVRPGELPYTPGLAVFTALAKAGGTPSARQLPPDQVGNAALAERDLRVAETELYGFLLRRAALDAALADAPEITPPLELKPLAQSRLIIELMARETALLEADRARLQEARELTRREQAQLDAEIVALTSEQEALAAQARVIDPELENMQGLAKKGLVTSGRVLDLQQFKADNEADRFRMAAFMSRARQQQTQLEARQRRDEEDQRQEWFRQRLAVSSDIERARARMEAAQIQRSSLLSVNVTDQMFGRTEARFTISRLDAQGALQVLPGEGATPLQPGDVLEVRLTPLAAVNTATTPTQPVDRTMTAERP